MSANDDAPVVVRVRRQDGPGQAGRWERFEVPRQPAMTVAQVLDQLAHRPRTIEGELVDPIVWESSCGWPVCGSCTMLINGQAHNACTTVVDDVSPKSKPLRLEPLSSFELRRDLWVDRSRLRRSARKLGAWFDPADEAAPADWIRFSRCTDCGACFEACPEAHPRSPFAGPAALNASHLAQLLAPEPARLDRLLGPGGIADCGHALNCLEICPELVELDEVMSASSRAASRHWLRTLFKRNA